MFRPALALAVGGLALAAAFPKVGWHLLVWVSIAPLLVAVRGGTAVRAFAGGALFGSMFRAGTLYWLVHAMTRFGGLPLPAAIAGAGALVLYLALYWALFALVARRIDLRAPSAPLVLAATWVGLEYVQGWLFSGFPWALVGYAAGATMVLAQVADLAGVYGLGFVAVAVNAALAACLLHGKRAMAPATTVAVLLVVTLVYGAYRLPAPAAATAGSALTVALVQGNVAQDRKWDERAKQATLTRHLELSARGARSGADLVIWPESSWPDAYGVERDAPARQLLTDLAVSEETALLVGTIHLYDVERGYEVANAAVLFDDAGEWRGRYEKQHLVPFGEYLPLQRFIGWLGPLVQAVGSMQPGAADQPLLSAESSGVPPFGLAICYEIIFPSLVRESVRQGAEFLVTMTNDAWYGTTSAPYQHFAMARMRAIETRRYLVRAANTGISGIIDPWGRVVESSPLEQEALVVGTVYGRDEISPYVRTGDLFALLCLLVAIIAIADALRTTGSDSRYILLPTFATRRPVR